MKVTTLLIIWGCLHVSAASMSQTITINVKNRPISQIFDMIRQQTNHKVIYNDRFVNPATAINVSATEMPLEDFLKKILNPLSLTYELKENTILIGKALSMLTSISSLVDVLQQQQTITGKVTDDKGHSLAGVTVRIKGLATGVVSNAQGEYSIRVNDLNAILVFSYVGYAIIERKVGKNSIINMTLEPQEDRLNEVVVVGYGTQQRKDITTSISTVKGSEIQNIPVSTPQSLLQGRAAGVQVIQNSGAPGGDVTVRIRGTTSINAGNDPLYIVDGVPVESGSLSNLNQTGTLLSPLASISADDIESIEVLKDAGALAVYGSRGANGVVLITTKRGKTGQASYSLSGYSGFQQDNKSTRLKMMNSEQFIEKIQEQRANGNQPLYGFLLPQEDGTLYDTDWQSAIFRTAPINNLEASIRGGENKIKFSASGSYLNQNGIVIFSGFERYTSRINIDYAASQKFKMGTNISYSYYVNNRATTDDSSNGLIWNAINKVPTMPIYNADGSFFNDDVSGTNNPVNFASNNKYINKLTTITGNIFGEYTIVPNLVVKTTFGINNSGVNDTYFQLGKATRNGTTIGIAASGAVNNWINENTLSYRKRIFKKHLITGLLGYSLQERSSFVVRANARGFGTDNISTLNAATTPTVAYSYISNYGLSSAFIRGGYNYDEKYLVEGTIRRDGSSRFGNNRRYSLFPAISAAWKISNEPFVKDNIIISDLKLRGSIGKTGNQTIGDYVSQGEYGTTASYNGISGIALTTLPNPNLTWETTMQYDGGIDLSILKSSITLSVDAYIKNTSNLLLNVPLTETTGFSSILQNIGKVQNQGVELSLQTQNIKTSKFNWSSNFNISFNRNKVLALYSGQDQIIVARGSTFTGSLNSYSLIKVGYPIGSFYGWKESGVYAYSSDNTTGLKNSSTGSTGYTFKGGDMKFQDTNINGLIDFDDRVIIGNAQPKFTGGFVNTIKYLGFDFYLLNTFSYGNDIVNGTRYTAENETGFTGDLTLLRRWRNEGDVTDVPVANHGDPGGNSRFSNRWIEDGSYFRIKTITLGYTLPAKSLSRIKMSSLRIYATAQNLWTFTNYTGYDPELSARFTGNVTDVGIDQGTYPQYRSFIIGINVGI